MRYSIYALLLLFTIATITLVFEKSLLQTKPTQHSEVTIVNSVEITDTVIVSTKGRWLYETNCATCHGLYGMVDGSSVRDAEKRDPWTDRRNLIRWIKNPGATMNELEYTKQLVAAYNGMLMP